MSKLAVRLFVEVVMVINAKCTAHGAMGSTPDAAAAELQPHVLSILTVGMHVDIADWPVARHMTTLITDVRVPFVISALVAQLTKFGANTSAGVRITFATDLHSIVIAALHLRVHASHQHRRPDTGGRIEHREITRGTRGRRYLRVHKGVPECS